MMGVGICLILLGCALVGRRKTIQKRFDPTHQVIHKYLPQAREQLVRHRMRRNNRALGHVGGSTPPRRAKKQSMDALCASSNCTPSSVSVRSVPSGVVGEVRVTIGPMGSLHDVATPVTEGRAAPAAQRAVSPHADAGFGARQE
mmetsp:Transcript_15869/g.40892  ORF Transcript_15869/g.40892 Transcript_15869/m.40892 type:complete len:144 (-) Transcript_15869:139-570(-)